MYRRVELFELENKEEIESLVSALRRVTASALVVSAEVGFDIDTEGYDACLLTDFQTKADCDGFIDSKEYINLMYEMPACLHRASFSWYREEL